ncbi:hypothetical protein LTS18_012942 [Coniosporium uncinatum]|uniref:Uncharacterized protein n=1 Tax=Coniosporium uncinatum TaxID=93489 RepID=A0ACC3D9D6_9PEZI|nr:hypothetical protein LTS18_012942 [Coniosporium uncinatum]
MFNRDNIDRLVENRMLPGARRLTQAVTRPWQEDPPPQRAEPSALLIADDDDEDDGVVFDNASMVGLDAKENAPEEDQQYRRLNPNGRALHASTIFEAIETYVETTSTAAAAATSTLSESVANIDLDPLLYIGKTIANAATAATLDVLHSEFPDSVQRTRGLRDGVTRTAVNPAGKPLGSSYKGWKQQTDLNRNYKGSLRRTHKEDMAKKEEASVLRRSFNLSSQTPQEDAPEEDPFDKNDSGDVDILSIAGSEDLELEAAKRFTKKRHNIYVASPSEYEDSDHESTDSLIYSPDTRLRVVSPNAGYEDSGEDEHNGGHDDQGVEGGGGLGHDGEEITESKFLNQTLDSTSRAPGPLLTTPRFRHRDAPSAAYEQPTSAEPQVRLRHNLAVRSPSTDNLNKQVDLPRRASETRPTARRQRLRDRDRIPSPQSVDYAIFGRLPRAQRRDRDAVREDVLARARTLRRGAAKDAVVEVESVPVVVGEEEEVGRTEGCVGVHSGR